MIATQKDIDALARTVWGEARGEGIEGMEAVACVIMNRLNVSIQERGFWWGNTIYEICRQPWQFSCWNEKDPNRPALLRATEETPHFMDAIDVAEDAALQFMPDPTHGATHYLNPHVLDIIPSWAKGEPLAIIGKHYFFRPPEVPKIVKKSDIEGTKEWNQYSILSQNTLEKSSSSARVSLAARLFGWLKKLLQK